MALRPLSSSPGRTDDSALLGTSRAATDVLGGLSEELRSVGSVFSIMTPKRALFVFGFVFDAEYF